MRPCKLRGPPDPVRRETAANLLPPGAVPLSPKASRDCGRKIRPQDPGTYLNLTRHRFGNDRL